MSPDGAVRLVEGSTTERRGCHVPVSKECGPRGHVWRFSNAVDFELNVWAAGDAARYRHYGSSSPTGGAMDEGGTLRVESVVPDEVVRLLRGRGHSMDVGTGSYGGYQAIRWDSEEEVCWGGTEMWKNGYVVGY